MHYPIRILNIATMINKEIFQQLSAVFEGVVNGTMSVKEANAITKSSGEDLKRLKRTERI